MGMLKHLTLPIANRSLWLWGIWLVIIRII